MTTPSASPQGILVVGSGTYPIRWEDTACNAPSPIVPLRATPCRFQPPCPIVPRPDILLGMPLRSALPHSLLVPYLAPLLSGLPMKRTAMSCPLCSIRTKVMSSNQYKSRISMIQPHVRPLTRDAGGEAYAKAKVLQLQLIRKTTRSQPLLVSLRTWQENSARLPSFLRTVPRRLTRLVTPLSLSRCLLSLQLQ
jgi:hypothetical protein